MSNRFLEKIAELTERPPTTSGLSPSSVPSKVVNTKKPIMSVVKTVARKALTKSAGTRAEGAVEAFHRLSGRAVGMLGGMGSLVGDAGHVISGGKARDVVAEAARIKNPYMTHKEITSLVSKKDDQLVKHLTDTIPGNINDINHPVYQYQREVNKRDASRVLGLTALGTAAYAKYKHDQENRYLQAMGQDYT